MCCLQGICIDPHVAESNQSVCVFIHIVSDQTESKVGYVESWEKNNPKVMTYVFYSQESGWDPPEPPPLPLSLPLPRRPLRAPTLWGLGLRVLWGQVTWCWDLWDGSYDTDYLLVKNYDAYTLGQCFWWAIEQWFNSSSGLHHAKINGALTC